MSHNVIQFNKFKTIIYFALRRLKIKSLDLYSYFKSRINRTSHRRRSEMGNYITYLRNWRKAGYTATILLGLTIFAILCPISFKAVDNLAEASAGTITESTLTYNASSSVASVSLGSINTAGSYASSNDTGGSFASFSISTNNATGYKVNIKVNSASGSTNLVDSNDTSNTIPTIDTDGIAITSNSFGLNRWGLLPSMYNGTTNSGDNAKYYRATTTGFIMNETDSANSSDGISNPDNYTLGLGLKADYNTKAGTYTNTTIIVEYVANPVNYIITYNKNTEDTVNNMPYSSNNNQQAGDTSNTTITLSNLIPTRTGYDFMGWCLGTVSTSSTSEDTCTGTIYNPNGDGTNLAFGLDQTLAMNSATIYAMWNLKDIVVTVNFAGNGVTGVTFTNDTYGNVSITTSGSIANLKYGVEYTITGTYSSNYEFDSWSTTNGTIGSTSSASTTYSTTSADTLTLTGKSSKLYMWNATSANCGTTMYDNRDGTERSYTTAKIGSLCWMTQNLMLGSSSAVTLYKATTNITADTYTLPARGTSGSAISGQYVWGNDTQCTDSSTTACAGYYSYAAATAGTNPSSGEASSDICPAGWRLPTQAELTTLKDTYTTGATLTASPFLGVYAGGYEARDNVFGGGGSYGHYWSSTTVYDDSRFAYYLYFNSSSANVYNARKSNGISVRCVAKS